MERKTFNKYKEKVCLMGTSDPPKSNSEMNKNQLVKKQPIGRNSSEETKVKHSMNFGKYLPIYLPRPPPKSY